MDSDSWAERPPRSGEELGASVDPDGADVAPVDLATHLQEAFPGALTLEEGPPAGEAPPNGDHAVTQLERLVGLHRAGALDDEEFRLAKARLLGLA